MGGQGLPRAQLGHEGRHISVGQGGMVATLELRALGEEGVEVAAPPSRVLAGAQPSRLRRIKHSLDAATHRDHTFPKCGPHARAPELMHARHQDEAQRFRAAGIKSAPCGPRGRGKSLNAPRSAVQRTRVSWCVSAPETAPRLRLPRRQVPGYTYRDRRLGNPAALRGIHQRVARGDLVRAAAVFLQEAAGLLIGLRLQMAPIFIAKDEPR